MKYLIAIALITQAAFFVRSAEAQAVPFSASAYNFETALTTSITARITSIIVPITLMPPMAPMTTKVIV
jgi:hypothetical protein